MSSMGTPGRRPSSALEWKLAFIKRVIERRESTGMSPAEFAAELERMSGRTVSYDTYRKYEKLDSKGSLLRHDLIYAFCELTKTHITYLFAGNVPFKAHHSSLRQEKRNVA